MEKKLDFRSYSNGLKAGKLLGLQCEECQYVTCPPKSVCEQCGNTELNVTELSGKGAIKTFTVTFVAPLGRESEAPYTIVMVSLDEGPWITGNLADMDPQHVTMDIIGKRVKAGFKVFPGDCYSNGEAARPFFSFIEDEEE